MDPRINDNICFGSSVEHTLVDNEDTGNLDTSGRRGRKRGIISPAERFRRTDAKEARRIRRFLAIFDEDGVEASFSTATTEQVKVNLPTGDDPKDDFLLVEEAQAGPDAILGADAEVVGLVGVEAAEVQVDPHLRAVSGPDFITVEVAVAEGGLQIGVGSVVAPAVTENVSGCAGLHIEAESVANPETMNDARLKKVRKAESMGTATAEPLAFPEKKMRADDALLVEIEAAPPNETAATSRPWNWDTLSKSQKGNWRKRHEK